MLGYFFGLGGLVFLDGFVGVPGFSRGHSAFGIPALPTCLFQSSPVVGLVGNGVCNSEVANQGFANLKFAKLVLHIFRGLVLVPSIHPLALLQL